MIDENGIKIEKGFTLLVIIAVPFILLFALIMKMVDTIKSLIKRK
jgi:hypothetical protein